MSFYVLFSFREAKREPEKKAGNPTRILPLRPPVSGAVVIRKIILRGFSFRKAPQGKMGNE